MRFAERHCQGRRYVIGDVSSEGTAAGLAKTHEFLVDFSPGLDRERLSQISRSLQRPPLALPPPEYVCQTGVADLMHPCDPERFPEVEEALDQLFDQVMDAPVATNGLYGMLDYGDLLNAHGRTHGYTYRAFAKQGKCKITDVIGWFNNECFDNCATQWVSYLRTGKRKHWRMAEAYSKHLEDVDTIHANGLHPEQVGLTHYHNIMHWSAGCSHSHTQIMGWLFHYYLTGNRRALEVAREAADNFLKSQEPCGIVSNRHGALRREFTGPMGCLWLFYEATWEERYGDCARRSMDVLLRSHTPSGIFPQDIFTGGTRGDKAATSADKPEPRGWLLEANILRRAYLLGHDRRIAESVVKVADGLMAAYANFTPGPYAEYLGDTFVIKEKISPLWLAFAHELTGEDRYLAPLREFLAELPAMARRWADFDKWVPIQIAGFLPRSAGVGHGSAVVAAGNTGEGKQ